MTWRFMCLYHLVFVVNRIPDHYQIKVWIKLCEIECAFIYVHASLNYPYSYSEHTRLTDCTLILCAFRCAGKTCLTTYLTRTNFDDVPYCASVWVSWVDGYSGKNSQCLARLLLINKSVLIWHYYYFGCLFDAFLPKRTNFFSEKRKQLEKTRARIAWYAGTKEQRPPFRIKNWN